MRKHKITLISILLCIVFAVLAACNAISSVNISGNSLQVERGLTGVPPRFVQVEGGEKHTLALTADGEIYSWGAEETTVGRTGNLDKPLPILRESIEDLANDEVFIKIVASKEASAALTNMGNIFTWGKGERNETGHASNSSTADLKNTPTKIQSFAESGIRFVDIAAGDYHMIAIGKKNSKYTLFGWGDNEFGQTGASTLTKHDNPGTALAPKWTATYDNRAEASLPNSITGYPTAVFAGGDTSCFIVDKKAYTFGRNKYTVNAKDGYALGYAGIVDEFILLKRGEETGPDTKDLTNIASPAANGIISDRTAASISKPSSAPSGYYQSKVSVGTFGTIYTGESNNANFFGFNADAMFSQDKASDGSFSASVMEGANNNNINITAVASPKLSSNDSVSKYVGAALNTTTRSLYVWGGGFTPTVQKFNGFSNKFAFIDDTIRFTALFAGYNCIYVLDELGKIYVLGENIGSKLCNVDDFKEGKAYPIEVDTTIYKKSNEDVAAAGLKGFNEEKSDDNRFAFSGRANPDAGVTSPGGAKEISFKASDLYNIDSDRAYDKIGFLKYSVSLNEVTDLYGTVYRKADCPEIQLSIGGTTINAGNPSFKTYIDVTLTQEGTAEPKLTIKFIKKCDTDITLILYVGKFANYYNPAKTLEQLQKVEITIEALNSAPVEKAPADTNDPDFADLNPNNKTGGGSTAYLQSDKLSNYFTDIDGDTVRFITNTATTNAITFSDADDKEFVKVARGQDGMSFTVEALKTPSEADKIVIVTLRVTDGDTRQPLEATTEIIITIKARPTNELKNGGKDISFATEQGDIIEVLPQTKNGKIYYVVADLFQDEIFELDIMQMFDDPADFTFAKPKRYDNDIIGGGVTIYPDGILADPVLAEGNKKIIFTAQKEGLVDYVVRIDGAESSIYYVFRFAVASISKSDLVLEENRRQIQVPKTGTYFLHGADGLFKSYPRNTLEIKTLSTSSELYANVEVSIDKKSFTVIPKQNGRFDLYLTVQDSRDPSIFKHITVGIEIARYYKASTVTITAGGAICPLEWFVTIIKNSETNSVGGGTSAKDGVEGYSFLNVSENGIITKGIPDELGITVTEIPTNNTSGLRFQLNGTRTTIKGTVVIEIDRNGTVLQINVPIEIKGIYSTDYSHDVADYKLNSKTSTIEFSPRDIAALLGDNIRVTPNSTITISDVRNNNSQKFISVSKDRSTGNLVVKPKENGNYKFEVDLIVDGNSCLVIIDFEVSNLVNLPTQAQYKQAFGLALIIAVVFVLVILIFRIIRWVRRKRLYKKEYEKYKMLTKIKRNTADPNFQDKEAVVRAKLKMLDPKYAKAYGDAKKGGKTTEEQIDAKKKKIEDLKSQLDKIESPEQEEKVAQKETKVKVAEQSEVATEETHEKPLSKKEQKAQSSQELSERDLLEEKIKARLAEEQAQAEARAAAEKAEEEQFQSMTKEERKRAEMLKKLKAKYNKK